MTEEAKLSELIKKRSELNIRDNYTEFMELNRQIQIYAKYISEKQRCLWQRKKL